MSTTTARLKQFFTIPVFSTPEEDHRARLLTILLWIRVSGIAIVILAGVITNTRDVAYYGIVGLFIPFGFVALYFLKRGFLRLASYLFVYAFWINLTIILFSVEPATVRINFAFYYLTILVGGLLLGTRVALALSVASIAGARWHFIGQTQAGRCNP